jgi:hypothetical protein
MSDAQLLDLAQERDKLTEAARADLVSELESRRLAKDQTGSDNHGAGGFPADSIRADEVLKGRTSQSIGGWLMVPAIGLVLTPVMYVLALWTLFAVVSGPTFADLVREYPNYTVVLFLLAATSTGMLILTGYVAYIFFTTKRHAPLMMICLLCCNFCVTLISVVATNWAFREDLLQSWGENGGILHAAVLASIWIPYFLRSKRVKRTFIA